MQLRHILCLLLQLVVSSSLGRYTIRQLVHATGMLGSIIEAFDFERSLPPVDTAGEFCFWAEPCDGVPTDGGANLFSGVFMLLLIGSSIVLGLRKLLLVGCAEAVPFNGTGYKVTPFTGDGAVSRTVIGLPVA